MAKYGKWILGGLGWVLFSPIGGLIGFAIGALLESGTEDPKRIPGETQTGDFIVSLLVLFAIVLKADGKVMRSELEVVKNFLVKQFGAEKAREALLILQELLKKDIKLDEVGNEINRHLDTSSKLQLMQLLFAISAADGHICKKEHDIIEQIAQLFNLSSHEFASVKSMFVEDTDSAYQILEVDRSATNDEIKKAYKQMAVKYHPDKVAYLGEEIKNSANERFKKINVAYESIKKERGIV